MDNKELLHLDKNLLKYTEIEAIFNHKALVKDIKIKSQKVLVLGGRLGLEAIGDKILIQLDKFKSGYECKTCNGEGNLSKCICVSSGFIPGQNRLGGECRICKGNPDTSVGIECPDCSGRGSTIIIPESAKSLPTSGIIVSKGPECKKREVGERVLFGAHTGYFIPFKGNVKIRCMREDEPLCLLSSVKEGDDVNMGDAIELEEIS